MKKKNINLENIEEMTVDSFKVYESSYDGIEKEVNGEKIINDFEMYPEEDNKKTKK